MIQQAWDGKSSFEYPQKVEKIEGVTKPSHYALFDGIEATLWLREMYKQLKIW